MPILKHVVALCCFIAVPISAQNDEPMVSLPVPLTDGYLGEYYVQFRIKLRQNEVAVSEMKNAYCEEKSKLKFSHLNQKGLFLRRCCSKLFLYFIAYQLCRYAMTTLIQ